LEEKMSIWDALEKAAYTGLGLAALTKDKLDEAVETLKRERGLTEEEGRRLAAEMKEGAENARRSLDNRVDAAVEKAYKKLKLATAAEVSELVERISELEKALNLKSRPRTSENKADTGESEG
jgi:polyhydroxyalkanoate synthesis regulator phasin